MTAVCSLAEFPYMGPADIANSSYVDTRKGHTHSQDRRTIDLDKYRGIAYLTAVRKLLGYLILAMLPDLVSFSVQCGFIPHRQTAEGDVLNKTNIGGVAGNGTTARTLSR